LIFLPGFLRWSDLAAGARNFDSSRARAIVEELLTAALGAARVDRDELEEEIDRALVAEYGAWASGWNWSASEPGGGGPVQSWCCADHSLLPSAELRGDPPADETDPCPTVDRVVAALEDWRAFVMHLEGAFQSIHQATQRQPLGRAAEHAAAYLLPIVVGRTNCEDAWYRTFSRVVTWYLEARGVESGRVRQVVADTISGRFASWSTPDDAAAKVTCEELGAVVDAAETGGAFFGLAEWLGIRGKAFERPPAQRPRTRVRSDGHRRYIEGTERARDPQRAGRMADALESARAAARRGTPLDFAALANFQRIALGVPAVEFRSGDAFAKQGRERYELQPDTLERFERCLAEVRDASLSVAARAARVYLDVCFFHPFEDGNARAARLALDYVLTTERLLLHAIEPIIVVSRAADDANGALSLTYVIERLLGRP